MHSVLIPCREHMALLMTIHPEHENDEMWLKNEQNETFPKWFKEKVLHMFINSYVQFIQILGNMNHFTLNLYVFL